MLICLSGREGYFYDWKRNPARLMLTALFITDCSVDSALLLRTWLSEQTHQPLSLTVVHPYDIPTGALLHKSVCQPAKAEALTRLNNWTAMMGNSENVYLTTEILFANPEVTLTIHLLIRGYNYLLVDDWSPVSPTALPLMLAKTRTTVQSIYCAVSPELVAR